MAYDLVPDEELIDQYKRFENMGVPQADLSATLERYAASRNSQIAADNTSIFTKALAVGADRLAVSTLTGVNEFLGGGKGMLTDAAETVKDWVNPFYEEQVAKAQAGQWWTNLDGWAASFGSIIPQVVELAALAVIPTPGTKYAALAKGAGFVSKLMALATEAAPMVGALTLSTTGDLKEAMLAAGVDEATASRNAKLGGVLAGAFFEPAVALKFVPRGATTEAMAKFFAGQLGSNAILKGAAKEIGLTAAAGLSTMSGVGISNAAFNQAFNDMAEKDPSWKSPEGYTPQSLTDAFIGGSLLTGAMRGMQRAPAFVFKFGDAREKGKGYIAQGVDKLVNAVSPLEVDVESPLISKKAQDIMATLLKPQSDEARLYQIDNEMKHPDLVDVANKIRMQNEPTTTAFTKDSDPEAIKNYVKNGLGSYVEGPQIALRDVTTSTGDPIHPNQTEKMPVVEINTPVLNPVKGTVRQYGENLENALRPLTANPDIFGLKDGSDTQKLALQSMKKVALERAGFAPEIVDHLMALSEKNPYDVMKSLKNVLTSDQYMRVASELEGYVFRDILKPMMAERAAGLWKPDILVGLAGSKFRDVQTGMDHPLMPLRNFSDIPALQHIVNTVEASFPKFRSLSDALKVNFVGLDHAMRVRSNQATQMMATIQDALNQSKWRMSPWMRQGGQQHFVNNVATHLLTNQAGKDVYRKQWFKGDELASAAKMIESKGWQVSKELNPDTVALMTMAYDKGKVAEGDRNYVKDISAVSKMADKHRDIYDMFGKLTGIPLDQFVQEYLPRYWNMTESGKSIGEVKKLEAERIDAIENMRDRMMESQKVQSFFDLIDSADSSSTRYGDSVLSSEHQRMSDKSVLQFMKIASLEDDPHVLMHMAMNAAIKKYYFSDLAPMMRVFKNDVVRESSLTGGKARGQNFDEDISAYFNEYMGHTPSDISVSNKMKLMNQTGAASRMIDGVWQWLDKNFGHKFDFSEKPTYGTMYQDFVKSALIYSVGFPGNPTMPLANFVQQSVATSIFGIKNLTMGMYKMFGKTGEETRAWGKRLGIQTQEHPMAATTLGNEPRGIPDKTLDHLTQLSLTPMDAMDTLNRNIGMSTAKHILDKVTASEKQLGRQLTRKELGQILTPKNLLDKKLSQFSNWLFGDHVKSLEKSGFDMKEIQEYKDGAPRGMSGILDATYDLYNRGKWDQAQRFYAQAVIDSTNFRYSQGGGVNIARNSEIGRHFAQFMRFPSNWVSQLGWIMNPKNEMYTAQLRFCGSTMIMVAALGSMGINASQELGFGPVPTSAKTFGPFARLFNSLFGLISTGGKAVQAQVGSEEDKSKAQRAFGTAEKNATPWLLR